MRPWPAAFLIVGSLAGCTSDDPGKGGFFGGLLGLMSGGYERRVAERSEAWTAEEARYQDEVSTKEELDLALAERRERAAQLDQDLVALEQDITVLNDEIDRLRTARISTEDEIVAVEAEVEIMVDEITKVRTESVDLNDDDRRQRADELQADIGRLQATIDLLRSR